MGLKEIHALLNERDSLKEQLESYQRARIHDVEEKNWLRDRVTELETELTALRSPASGEVNDI
jgi:predicted  nucleic acid-binding Zn-ribbon protein